MFTIWCFAVNIEIVLLIVFFVICFGLIAGSFIAALTYRAPKNISILNDRSRCPHCKNTIAWQDNIPVLSYILLGGKCRNCQKSISLRYPLIEIFTALGFLSIYLYLPDIFTSIPWAHSLSRLSLPYFFSLIFILIAIFVIDLENKLIPDELVFVTILLNLAALVITNTESIFMQISIGLFFAILLFALNLATKGKGMGLGDVKLAVPLAMLFDIKLAVVWFLFSFVIGAMVGIVAILIKKASIKAEIPFGPFLISSFFLVLFYGQWISENLLVYY